MSFHVNSFQLPNALIDSGLVANMSYNDLKCYLVVVRKTAGWHKEWDFIPATQLMELTGIKKRQTVYVCMENLENYGLIESKKIPGKTTEYKLRVVPSNGTCTNNSSTCNSNEVVPPEGTSTSTVEGYTTKDTTKDIKTKDKKSKQKKDDLEKEFRSLIKKISQSIKFKSKAEFTKKGLNAYKALNEDERALIYSIFVDHVEDSGQYAKRLAGFLEDFDGYRTQIPKQKYHAKEPEVGSIAWKMQQDQKQHHDDGDVIDAEVC